MASLLTQSELAANRPGPVKLLRCNAVHAHASLACFGFIACVGKSATLLHQFRLHQGSSLLLALGACGLVWAVCSLAASPPFQLKSTCAWPRLLVGETFATAVHALHRKLCPGTKGTHRIPVFFAASFSGNPVFPHKPKLPRKGPPTHLALLACAFLAPFAAPHPAPAVHLVVLCVFVPWVRPGLARCPCNVVTSF